jgi:hypothetical protein
MIFMIRCLILCLCVTTLYAQQIPGSEIYLFDLKYGKDQLVLSNPKNVTNHPGYDNQPFFHPDKSILYFASANEEGRTDIVEYDLVKGTTRKITDTPEREYSPTVTPDKKFLSCIIQRDNGAQDLGKYPIDGGTAEVIINNLTVGYHAWADNNTLYMFVLGNPLTLHRYSVAENKDEVVESNIGRSIHKIPGTSTISFVHKEGDDKWLVKKVDGKNISTLGETLPKREDLAWTPDSRIIMSDGENFFFADPTITPMIWKQIKLESQTLKGITRLAVSGDGSKLAVVVSE